MTEPMAAPRSPEDPSPLGWMAYRFFHYPRQAFRTSDFWLYLLLQRVRGGPFKGMRYVGQSCNPRIAPFLLGLNEKEIWPFVERIAAGDFDLFINVGAAEGYYAVGMALRSRTPKVVAYEGSRAGRVLTRFMARRNGVDERIDVRGYCTPEELRDVMASAARPAVLMDVEGFEEALADPVSNPHLRRATLIIELHEHEKPMADLLRPRFADTHDIAEAWTRPMTVADLPDDLRPASWFLSRERLLELGREDRGRPMRWWLLTPMAAAAGS